MLSTKRIKEFFNTHPRKATAGVLLAATVTAVAVALIVNLATRGQLLQFLIQSWTTPSGKGVLLGVASGAGALGLTALFIAPLVIGKDKPSPRPLSEKEPLMASSSTALQPGDLVGIFCVSKTDDEIKQEFNNLPSLSIGERIVKCSTASMFLIRIATLTSTLMITIAIRCEQLGYKNKPLTSTRLRSWRIATF